MPLNSWGIDGGLKGPLVVPGVYGVTLAVNGRESTAKLTVKKDPNTTGTLEDIKAQVTLALQIRDDLNIVVEDINRIEWLRKQLTDLQFLLTVKETQVKKAAEDLDKKLLAVEGRYFQTVLAEGDLKSFRAPNKLYSQLALLASDIAGDSADFPPTDQQAAVYRELKEELNEAKYRLQELLKNDIPIFNRLLEANKLSRLITR